MSNNWTESQKDAIFSNGGTILVSAAAGSGKTAVLVQKVIELITDTEHPVDADRLLVVTFTRAAASEMKERISNAIDELLENDPGNYNLLRQKQLIYKANISTIDSFCTDISREYFYLLGINKDYKIADENELAILKSEAMDETLEHFYDNNDEEFIGLVEAFSSPRNDSAVRDIIEKVYNFLRSDPFPENWMSLKLNMYGEDKDPSLTPWGKAIIAYADLAIRYCLVICDNMLHSIREAPVLEKYSCFDLACDYSAYLDKASKILKNGSWEEIGNTIHNFDAGRLTFPRKFEDDVKKEQIKNSRENIKAAVEELKKLFAWSSEECNDDIAKARPLISAIFKCVNYYEEIIKEKKKLKNIADFSDIEHFAIELLVRQNSHGDITFTETAKEISKRFDYIMVDEFQDVNLVQDLIFRAVSNNNRFMVGDVKQSIYGFRHAMPELFLSMKKQYPLYDRNTDNYPAKIILDKNFRSREEIADGVNFVFSLLMSPQVGEMEYTEEERLQAAAKFEPSDDAGLSLALLDRDSYDSEIDFTVLEARYIAVKIHEMVMSGYKVKDGDKMRKAEYSDFAVLLRSTELTSQIYVNELVSMGIPAYSEKKESFLSAKEIKVMLNFLRIIDNPVRDIPLLSVMMSPIYGFTADEMALAKLTGEHKNLYSAVSAFAKENEKAKSFLDDLAFLRTYAITHTVEELIRYIYDITAYPAIVSATETRTNATKNLSLLCKYASDYESKGYKGLSSFVRYIDKIEECGCDFQAGAPLDGVVTNTVKVMSIHASKGLEFPVCFVAASSKEFNKKDLGKDVLLHSKMGIGIRKTDGLCKFTTMPREGVALTMSDNQMSEELRVLYVALTRAKEKLIVVNSQKSLSGYIDKLLPKIAVGGKIPPYAVKNAKSIGDWMTICALANPKTRDLSDYAGMSEIYKAPDNSCKYGWNIDFVNSEKYPLEDYSGIFDSDIFGEENILQSPPPDFIKTLIERINYRYKYAPLTDLPVKVSASDIAHKESSAKFSKILRKPEFLSGEKLTAVQKGTGMHKLMQFCDFKNLQLNMLAEIQRLVQSNRLTKAEADSINPENVRRFLEGELAQRIMSSPNVLREFRFMTEIDASAIRPDISDDFKDSKILLQGAVDLAFEEDGNLVIVDYKTDRVKDVSSLAEMYKSQLMLYKSAMEQATDKKVSECIIYSLHLSKEITVYKS